MLARALTSRCVLGGAAPRALAASRVQRTLPSSSSSPISSSSSSSSSFSSSSSSSSFTASSTSFPSSSASSVSSSLSSPPSCSSPLSSTPLASPSTAIFSSFTANTFPPALFTPLAPTAPSALELRRSFARRRSLIKRMMKEAKGTGREPRIQMSMPSVSMIISPYHAPNNVLNPLTWVSSSKNFVLNSLARYRIQKHMPAFKTRVLAKDEAKEMYITYQESLAQSDMTELQKITTPAYLHIIKERVEAAAEKLAQAGARVTTRTEDVTYSVKAARHAAVEVNGSEFAQVTILFESRQFMDIVNHKGKRIGGTAEGEGRRVKEYVVYERLITKPSSRWNICCVSDHMPPDPELYQWLEGGQNEAGQ